MQSAAQLIRARREAHGLTQARLARRAGTTQAAISRLERGHVSPTFEALAELLLSMGERPEPTVRPLELDGRSAPAGRDARPTGGGARGAGVLLEPPGGRDRARWSASTGPGDDHAA